MAEFRQVLKDVIGNIEKVVLDKTAVVKAALAASTLPPGKGWCHAGA